VWGDDFSGEGEGGVTLSLQRGLGVGTEFSFSEGGQNDNLKLDRGVQKRDPLDILGCGG